MAENQWDGRPLVAPNEDGWHWVGDSINDLYCAFWNSESETWGSVDYGEMAPEEFAEDGGEYHGPCLPPAEVERLQRIEEAAEFLCHNDMAGIVEDSAWVALRKALGMEVCST